MNGHEQYAALLDAFIDEALSEEDAARVREHLTVCPECRSYVSDALAMRELFPGIEETPVPDDFADSVMSALSAQRIPWRKQWKKAALPLAACVAVALLLRGLYVLPTGAMGGGATNAAAPEMALMDAGGGGVAEPTEAPYDALEEYAESAEDAAEFQTSAGSASARSAASNGAAQKATSNGGAASKSARVTSDNGEADAANGADAGVVPMLGASYDGAASVQTPFAFSRSDDADTMPPALSEPSVEDAAPAQPETAPFSDPEATLYATDAVAEESEWESATSEAWDGETLAAVTVSVWTLSADAAPVMERYPPDAVTPEGIWYVLTSAQFEELCERFPDIEITAGPEDMDAESLPDGAPPLTDADAVYLFAPNPAS